MRRLKHVVTAVPRGAGLVLLQILLAGSPAAAEPGDLPLQVRPIETPIRLEYRPAHASYSYGSIAIEHTGKPLVSPMERISASISLVSVESKLAMTEEWVERRPGAKDSAEHGVLRMLLTPSGEVQDAVMSYGKGRVVSADDRPLPARNFAFPRLPDHAVAGGDTVFDYDWDFDGSSEIPPGMFPIHFTGTVRGTGTYLGRRVVVLDYQAHGVCRCGDVRYDEEGYQLMDIATGLVSLVSGRIRISAETSHATWSFGSQLEFR